MTTSPDLEALKALVALLKANPFKLDANRETIDAGVSALERLLAGQREVGKIRAPFDPQAYWLPPGDGRKEMVVLASHYSKPSEYPDALGGWNKSGWVPLYSALAAPPVQEAGRELPKVVAEHIADLKRVAAVLDEDGRFKETADEVRVAIGELEDALATEPASLGAEADVAETAQHVYITDKEAVICGIPERRAYQDENTAHNCDAMGCSTLEHILRRVPFTDERKHQPIKAAAPVASEDDK